MYLHTQAFLHRVLSTTLFSDNASSVNMPISNKNTHSLPLCSVYCRKIVICLSDIEKQLVYTLEGQVHGKNAFPFSFGWLTVGWELA